MLYRWIRIFVRHNKASWKLSWPLTPVALPINRPSLDYPVQGCSCLSTDGAKQKSSQSLCLIFSPPQAITPIFSHVLLCCRVRRPVLPKPGLLSCGAVWKLVVYSSLLHQYLYNHTEGEWKGACLSLGKKEKGHVRVCRVKGQWYRGWHPFLGLGTNAAINIMPSTAGVAYDLQLSAHSHLNPPSSQDDIAQLCQVHSFFVPVHSSHNTTHQMT